MVIDKRASIKNNPRQAHAHNSPNVDYLYASNSQRNEPNSIKPFSRKRNDKGGKNKHHINSEAEIFDVDVYYRIV